MPVYMLDEDNTQQHAGAEPNINRSRIYAMDSRNPLQLFDLGGHMITEAPELSIAEAAPTSDMVTEGGQNKTLQTYKVADYVQSVSVVIGLPKREVTTAVMLKEAEERGNRFLFFTVPADDCPDDCDKWALYFGDAPLMGVIQRTNGLAAFDTTAEGGGAITRTVRVRSSGDLRNYRALRYNTPIQEGLAPLYAVLLGDKAECDAARSFCPYQVAYLGGGSGGAEDAPAAHRTGNKFGTLDAIDLSALPDGALITALARYGSKLFIGYADTFRATSAAGGLAVSVNGGAATLVSDITTNGIQTLVKAGNRLHAFGAGGEWFYTDDGNTWVTATTFTSETLNAAAYNSKTRRLYVVGTNGAAYVIRGLAATAMAALSAVTDDFRSVQVLGDDHIAVGDDVGVYRETFGEAAGEAWTTKNDFGAPAPINVILGDKRSTRVLVTVGDEIFERSINHKQGWVSLGTAPAVITAGSAGYEEYQRGVDYFALVTQGGDVVEVEQCVPCSLS